MHFHSDTLWSICVRRLRRFLARSKFLFDNLLRWLQTCDPKPKGVCGTFSVSLWLWNDTIVWYGTMLVKWYFSYMWNHVQPVHYRTLISVAVQGIILFWIAHNHSYASKLAENYRWFFLKQACGVDLTFKPLLASVRKFSSWMSSLYLSSNMEQSQPAGWPSWKTYGVRPQSLSGFLYGCRAPYLASSLILNHGSSNKSRVRSW